MLAIVIGWVFLLRLSVGKRSDRILKSIFLKQREYSSVHSCSSETPEPMVLEKIIEISDRISFKHFFRLLSIRLKWRRTQYSTWPQRWMSYRNSTEMFCRRFANLYSVFSCGFLLLWVSIFYRAVTSCQWMLSRRSNSSFFIRSLSDV